VIAHGPDTGQLAFDDGTPLHDAERARILKAIRVTAHMHGTVDPGRVRRLLTDHRGDLIVDPRRLSGAYSWLLRRGLIERAGWTTNDDRRGGNQGKPARTYTVVDAAGIDAAIGEAS
jgi:hypothetical protein